MIKIFPSQKLDNPKIYPTYLDPFSQVISQPDLKILRRRLYADAIMNELKNTVYTIKSYIIERQEGISR
ncbi:MAG: hypothetical protein N2V78_08440 [Methanophagales archaeon]|nr:hypothetical protein [Methanophagales archaeon]